MYLAKGCQVSDPETGTETETVLVVQVLEHHAAAPTGLTLVCGVLRVAVHRHRLPVLEFQEQAAPRVTQTAPGLPGFARHRAPPASATVIVLRSGLERASVSLFLPNDTGCGPTM